MSATGPLPTATRAGLQLARELSALLGGSAVSCAPADLWAAGNDEWPRLTFARELGQSAHLPEVIAWPGDSDQVAAVIRFARERRLPVVPVGGGAGASGAALPQRGGIALELTRLCAPPRIDVERRSVEVQAGFRLGALEKKLQDAGCTLGDLPPGASRATIGGFLATRSGGASSGQLGKAEDLLLALEAIDGTGARLRTHEGPSRGLDLAQLLLGSEGTLAVFTQARLRIAPRPRARAVLGLRFASMLGGMRAMQAVVRSGLRPSLARLLDPLSAWLAGVHAPERPLPQPLRGLLTSGQQEGLRLALRTPRLLSGLADALGGHALLLLRFDGHGDRAAEDAAEEVQVARRICEQIGAGAALSEAAAAEALRRRDGGTVRRLLGSEESAASGAFARMGAFLELLDVAATWEKLPAVLGAVRRAAAPHALLIARVGCAYLEGASLEAALLGPVGPLAQSVARLRRSRSSGGRTRAAPAEATQASQPLPPELADELQGELEQANLRAEQCLSSALSAALDAGATLSHAGGIGLARQLLLPREHGEGMRQLRALKAAFDPQGILNPGKLLL